MKTLFLAILLFPALCFADSAIFKVPIDPAKIGDETAQAMAALRGKYAGDMVLGYSLLESTTNLAEPGVVLVRVTFHPKKDAKKTAQAIVDELKAKPDVSSGTGDDLKSFKIQHVKTMISEK